MESEARKTPEMPSILKRAAARGEACAARKDWKCFVPASGPRTGLPGTNFRLCGFGVVCVWMKRWRGCELKRGPKKLECTERGENAEKESREREMWTNRLGAADGRWNEAAARFTTENRRDARWMDSILCFFGNADEREYSKPSQPVFFDPSCQTFSTFVLRTQKSRAEDRFVFGDTRCVGGWLLSQTERGFSSCPTL